MLCVHEALDEHEQRLEFDSTFDAGIDLIVAGITALASRSSTGCSGGVSAGARSNASARPSWSPSTSPVTYTAAEVRTLTPVRRSVEARAHTYPDLRDVFLCHAWDDRRGAATELHDLLESNNVSVWFSEKDVMLGAPLLRAIDKALAKSRAGIVLVTPALLGTPGARPADPRRARDDIRGSPGGQPPARLVKRLEHRGRLDGRHRGQDRQAGRRVGLVTRDAVITAAPQEGRAAANRARRRSGSPAGCPTSVSPISTGSRTAATTPLASTSRTQSSADWHTETSSSNPDRS